MYRDRLPDPHLGKILNKMLQGKNPVLSIPKIFVIQSMGVEEFPTRSGKQVEIPSNIHVSHYILVIRGSGFTMIQRQSFQRCQGC